MGYWDSVEPYWEQVNIYDGPVEFLRTFATVPPVVRTLIAAHWCESEVSNGGLHQFFSNPTGVLAPEAVGAFEELGVPELAAVLVEAMAFFGAPYPRDQEARVSALPDEAGPRQQWDPFFELDERFYEACGHRDDGRFVRDRLFVAMDAHAVGRR